MSFLIAFSVLVGMQISPKPETRSQAALAITVVLGALSVMVGEFFVLIGWIDWSFWAAVISIWVWSMIMLAGGSKPDEPMPIRELSDSEYRLEERGWRLVLR